MDREKAIAIVKHTTAVVWSTLSTIAFVDALAALGILKLEERSPNTPNIKDTLANVVLRREGQDPKMGAWRIGQLGADMILKALDDAGLYIGKYDDFRGDYRERAESTSD
jgi:hypothetical protein